MLGFNKISMKVLPSILILLLALHSKALSQDLDSGITAFKRGDYQTALHNLLPLADIDMDYTQLRISENNPITNPLAQYYLGLMYCQGMGVTRDRIKALGWFNKARRGGNSLAEVANCNP